ncbi:RagB/SusD family nutrient uptake outer membrane protein [Muricauda sp. SCSIO 64092]|uniref:RagB/SusD family nutrient uptake outer membrane protein n=1 Tax=Allomuricauda sp. SCSIO 64092 TaxID=2908842 RepID=UPI001FF4D148|nr:RagB/SusD family nutrient uptake outer membrane protein [Muricauda sp. SCSIO 64092]UOY04860.1 RagB/SusD family nutrient uptake outer membrane protein [Muricauda sp. SCSIO 64092]
MKTVYTFLLGSLLLITACDNDLDQVPPINATSDSLKDFTGVLNAAYFYQIGAATPMAVMGDFRADNAFMFEAPFTEFDEFDADLPVMEDQFFGPFYTAMYRSILSTNNVIENSSNATQIGEAKFLRALSYFKLVQVFGDVPVNLLAAPPVDDTSIFARQPASDVYDNVIIPDLQDAISALDNSEIANDRASQIAAQSLLGKVYVHRGDFSSAETHLAAVVNGAIAADVNLQDSFNEIFGAANEGDDNKEIIFATKISSSVEDEYSFSEFWSWSGGLDTKSLEPLDTDLIAAFDASPGDLRRAVTIDETLLASPKFPQVNGPEHDWIEIRLADVILLYSEALNENGNTAGALTELNKIRTRAGLANSTATTQAQVRQAIQDERRLELAFEGHRWFDLVRTSTVDAEMGQTINSDYHLFPVPISEILATGGVITQNPGY